MSEGFLSVELFKFPNSSLQQESGIQSGKKDKEEGLAFHFFSPGLLLFSFIPSSSNNFLLDSQAKENFLLKKKSLRNSACSQ